MPLVSSNEYRNIPIGNRIAIITTNKYLMKIVSHANTVTVMKNMSGIRKAKFIIIINFSVSIPVFVSIDSARNHFVIEPESDNSTSYISMDNEINTRPSNSLSSIDFALDLLYGDAEIKMI